MTGNHFIKQMDRMIDVYGEKAFPEERCNIIWTLVKDFSDSWMTQSADYFIGYEQYPPMLAKWQDRIAIAREQVHHEEKNKHEVEAKEAMNRFSQDDERTMIGMIIKRITGGVNDQSWSQFKNVISFNETVHSRCSKCQDEGIYFDEEYRGMTVCSCKGRRDERRF